MTANDTEGSKYSRTSGQVTLVANNPKLNLDQSAKLNVEKWVKSMPTKNTVL